MSTPRKPKAKAPSSGAREDGPRELTADDLAHIAALSERFADALSPEQVESNYRMSLGMPDASGRVPSAREQLGALKLFADLVVPRPKAADEPREQAVIHVIDPYSTPGASRG